MFSAVLLCYGSCVFSKYRAGEVDEIKQHLSAEIARNPARIPYCVHIDRTKPGCFCLSWIIQESSSPFKSLWIGVTPDVCVPDDICVSWITDVMCHRAMVWGARMC